MGESCGREKPIDTTLAFDPRPSKVGHDAKQKTGNEVSAQVSNKNGNDEGQRIVHREDQEPARLF